MSSRLIGYTPDCTSISLIEQSSKPAQGTSKNRVYSLTDIKEEDDIILEKLCNRHFQSFFKSFFGAIGSTTIDPFKLRHIVVRDVGTNLLEGVKWRETLQKDLGEELSSTEKVYATSKQGFVDMQMAVRKSRETHAYKVIWEDISSTFKAEKIVELVSSDKILVWLLDNLEKITELFLRSKKLRKLPEKIGLLNRLKTLHLGDNQLTRLPRAFKYLTRLSYLELYGNGLQRLPKEIGLLEQLSNLDLRGNRLRSLPREIQHLTQLHELDLTGNQLLSLPKEIGLIEQLQFLYLNDNQLTSLPEEMRHLSKLIVLGLRNNRLTGLPSQIGQLLKLQELDVQNNPLNKKKLPQKISIFFRESPLFPGLYQRIIHSASESRLEEKCCALS